MQILALHNLSFNYKLRTPPAKELGGAREAGWSCALRNSGSSAKPNYRETLRRLRWFFPPQVVGICVNKELFRFQGTETFLSFHPIGSIKPNTQIFVFDR